MEIKYDEFIKKLHLLKINIIKILQLLKIKIKFKKKIYNFLFIK